MLAASVSLAPSCTKGGISKGRAIQIVKGKALAENKKLFGQDDIMVTEVTRRGRQHRVKLTLKWPRIRLPGFRCGVRVDDGSVEFCEALQPFGKGFCVKRYGFERGVADAWSTVTCAGYFSLRVPTALRLQAAGPSDGYAARFSNAELVLSIYYGHFTGSHTCAEDEPGCKMEDKTIGGMRAEVASYPILPEENEGFTRMTKAHFPSIERGKVWTDWRLTITVRHREQMRALAWRMLGNVQFPK